MEIIENVKILIVDDSPISLKLILSHLSNFGYKNTICARSAKEAFEILEPKNNKESGVEIDLILMDVVMDGMNGIEAVRRIKKKKGARFMATLPVKQIDVEERR